MSGNHVGCDTGSRSGLDSWLRERVAHTVEAVSSFGFLRSGRRMVSAFLPSTAACRSDM